MAGPLSWFRKHQKTLMGAAVVLAMVTFGLGAMVFLRKGRRWLKLRSPTLRAPNSANA